VILRYHAAKAAKRSSEYVPMDWDFSKVNLEYLIQARDLARSNPRTGAMLLGMSDDLVQLLSEISARELALITQFKPPLIAPRHAAWWWQRLLNALQAGNPEELQIILDHAGLLVDT
jgi:hypothetical protein